jgi:hypothetical protein
MFWDAHEYFMHPIFVLKNGCDILGVETIHKNQPSEELDTWSTSRFPDDFENRMSLHVLEYFRIETP